MHCLQGDLKVGHRLSRIYTRTGDDGSTGLADGSRVAKDHPRIVAIGGLDELNCWIGRLIATLPDGGTVEQLLDIQQRLFDAGGEVSIPGHRLVTDQQVSLLETWTDQYNEQLPPLNNFVLPRGSERVTVCHLARAVCRRAERDCIALREQPPGQALLAYVNRLSDFLFVLARHLDREDGNREILWQQTDSGE